jgi:hypothetical protein
MCVHFTTGECHHGNKCSFAHSKAELRQAPETKVYDPKKTKTKTIKQCRYGNDCTNESCYFAHEFDYEYDETEETVTGSATESTSAVAASTGPSKAKAAYVTPTASPAGTPWKVVTAEAEKPNHTTTRSNSISDLPFLVSRISKMGFNWTDEVISWAVFKVASMKNLAAGGAIIDSEVIDFLHANPGKGRKKVVSKEVDTSGAPSKKECIICLDDEREVVLVPCGHATLCWDCSEGLRECPTCRCEVESAIRFFL